MNLRAFGQHLLAQKQAAVAGQRYLNADGNRCADNSQRQQSRVVLPHPAIDTALHTRADASGWLSPLSEGVQNPLPNTSEKTASVLLSTVAINPALLNGMVKRGHTSAGRLWLLCRAMDRAGRGVVRLDMLRQQLANKADAANYVGSWRRIRQIVARGEGVFWVRGRGRIGRGRLYLAGASVVGRRLGIHRLERHNVKLAVADLVAGTKRGAGRFLCGLSCWPSPKPD